MKKFLIFTVCLIVISSTFLFLFRDFIVKKTFESILSNNLNRTVEIGSFDVGYLSGEVNLEKIEINNKDFPGKLLIIDKAFAQLDALSFYGETIEIENILLDGVRVNYFSDMSNRSNNNFNSLKRTLENKNRSNSKPDSKKFLIEKLDIKNINVSATSLELNLTHKVVLNDMKFTNLGNAKGSKNYNILAREIIEIANREIKDKIKAGAFSEEVIKDKIKEQLKKKFKKLLK
ncbi:hypothetical protein IDH21_05080 [Pelagibacterales bacterium SAG-MED47]|nr:hypothetical protein [Pelagibacterales bacterium SAG-MED47]